MRWDGSSNSNWNNGDNWSTSLPPTAGSTPVVSGPAPTMPILTGGVTSLSTLYVGYDNTLGGAGLTINGGASLTTTLLATIGEQSNNNAGNARELESGSATLTGASNWTNADLQIGAYGLGTVSVTGGSTLTTTTSLHLGVHHNIATNRSGNGTLTISGSGSQWISSGDALIGELGSGTVSVTGGGKATTRGVNLGHGLDSSGTVTVSGAGSRWETLSSTLVIGNAGRGQFTLSGGATAKTGAITLANAPNSSGALTITGNGSRFEAGQIRVGERSTGSLAVTGGGQLKATQILLGSTASARGEIDLRGSGSLIDASGYTMIGWFGEGKATVAEGATLRGTVRIAHEPVGRGTLTIGAAAGSPAVAPGTVDAATIQFGAGTGKLVFNHTDSGYVLASSIKGTGSIEHQAGTTLFTGNSTTFTGTTTISGGTLLVGNASGGSLGGAVSVLNGGTLGGSGTVGSVILASGATLSPGNSVGTLKVSGNATFNAGSTYRAEIVGGASDLLSVGGTASLAGTLQLVAGGGSYSFNAPYTVLTAAGGRSGTFDTVSSGDSFGVGVTSEVSYGSNDVKLTLKPGSLVDAGSFPAESLPGQTPSPGNPPPPPSPNPVYNTASGLSLNTWSVAAAIDRAVANGADPSFLYQIYARGDRQALIAALSTLTGEVHASVDMIGWEAAGGFLRAMLDPFATGRDPNAMPGAAGAFATAGSYASTGAQAELPAAKGARIAPQFVPDRLYNLWGQGFGSKSRSGADIARGSHASDASSGHLALGIDFRVLPDTILGVAIAAGESRSSLSGALGETRADILQAGLYGLTRIGALSLGASLGYASAEVETSRAIPLIGAFAIRGQYRAEIWSGRAEAAWRLASFGGLSASPYAAFTAQNLRTPGFIERDGVTGLPAGLAVQSRDGTTARTELGLRLDATTSLFGLSATAFGKLGWGYYARRDNQFSASLIGLPGSGFGFQGTRPDRNTALVATGLDVRLSNAVSLGARFNAELSQNTQSYAGAATLKVSF
jgi:T5SS/PEP-CTERM-associated repeat protein